MGNEITTSNLVTDIDVEILLEGEQQIIDGFGSCFNELGWTSLNLLSELDKEQIFNELFAPGVGANDFSLKLIPFYKIKRVVNILKGLVFNGQVKMYFLG